MLRTMVLAALLLACHSDRGDRTAQALLRDLTRAGDTLPDTTGQLADSQFQACLYVYETPERIRECLVVRNGWTAEDAARRIAVYGSQLQHRIDSLHGVWDSLELARRRSRDRLDGPPLQTYPDSGVWMADDRTRGYYRTSCPAALRIPVRHRVYFTTREDAQAAGLWRSVQPGC